MPHGSAAWAAKLDPTTTSTLSADARQKVLRVAPACD
jgi:hypothetical protein